MAATLPMLPPMQRPLWLIADAVPELGIYNVGEAWMVRGSLDPDGLRHALDRLCERHSSLRSLVIELSSAPYIAELPVDSGFVLDERDLRGPPADVARSNAERIIRELVRCPIVLSEGPLARACLLRTADQEWIFAIVLHHLVCDGESVRLLTRELGSLYEGNSAAEPRVAIVTHALYGRHSRNGDADRRANDLSFWRDHLAGVFSRPRLPTDRRVPATRRHDGQRITLPFADGWYERIRTLAADLEVFPFAVLLTALAVVVSRFVEGGDVVICTTMNARHHKATEDAIGFFVKTLPLRLAVDPSSTVVEMTRLAHSTVVAAMDHMTHVEFDEVIATVDRGDAGSASLTQISMELIGDQGSLSLGDADVQPFPFDSGIARNDMTMYLASSPDAVSYLEYSTELYDEATMNSVAAAMATVVSALTDHLHAPVEALPITAQSELSAIATLSAGPTQLECDDDLLPLAVRRYADAFPNDSAVFGPSLRAKDSAALTCLTYGDLYRRADLLARRLHDEGVQPGSTVGSCLPRSVDQMVSMFAIWALGAVFVPLDPLLPTDRLIRMCALANLSLVVVAEQSVSDTAFARKIPTVVLDEVGHKGEIVGELLVPVTIGPDDLAYIIFTSGTSGTPKPVAVQHRALAAFRAAMRTAVFSGLPPRAGVAVNAPIFFDAAFQSVQLLGDGHPIYVVPDSIRSDPAAFLGFLHEHDIHVTDCTPTHALALVDAGLLDSGRSAPRMVVMGGEPVSAPLWARAQASTIHFVNVYGPTEFTVNATTCSIDAGMAQPVIGTPLPGTTVEVLDTRFRPVPIGFAGEIYLSGPQLSLGYSGQARLTADKFLPAPGGRRRYRTGDIAKWRSTGMLDYLGRRDGQVKLLGHRIELSEITEVLRAAPNVRDAAVILSEEGAPRLVAFLVGDSSALSTQDVTEFATRALPSYMIPAHIHVVASLPRKANGKLDTRALLEIANAARLQSSPRRTLSAIEHRLLEIWCKVLGRADLSVGDDFFQLGGHSLLATRLLRQVNTAFGIRLPLSVVFQERTLSAMALHLERATRNVPPATTPHRVLVPLAAGRGGRPLVIAHPLGGSLAHYDALLPLLPPEAPVFGLRSPTMAGETEPPDAESLLELYADEVSRGVQSRTIGLFGWSLGGLIAIGMCAELERRGFEVAFVEAWDCGLSTANPLSERDLVRMTLRALAGEQVLGRLVESIAMLPADVGRDDPRIAMLLRAAHDVAGDAVSRGAFDDTMSILRQQSALFRTWMPKRIRAPIHVVLAGSELRTGTVHHTDWDQVTTGGWTERIVDCDHHGMVRLPALTVAIAELVSRLQDDMVLAKGNQAACKS